MTDETPYQVAKPLDVTDTGDSSGFVPTRPGSIPPTAEPVVRQLDSIIENLTGYARPILREIAARAAELAAKAGEAAGPMAHKAAEKTEEVGGRLATKGRAVASDIRGDSPSPTFSEPTTERGTKTPEAIEAGLPLR